MADDERRAGIEAAEDAVEQILRPYSSVLAPSIVAERIVAVVLVRVRDARDDDEAGWKQTRYGRVRAIIGEPFGPGVDVEAAKAARSPQSEDHEDEVGRIVRFLVDAGCEAAAAMVEIEFGSGHESA